MRRRPGPAQPGLRSAPQCVSPCRGRYRPHHGVDLRPATSSRPVRGSGRPVRWDAVCRPTDLLSGMDGSLSGIEHGHNLFVGEASSPRISVRGWRTPPAYGRRATSSLAHQSGKDRRNDEPHFSYMFHDPMDAACRDSLSDLHCTGRGTDAGGCRTIGGAPRQYDRVTRGNVSGGHCEGPGFHLLRGRSVRR